MRIIRSDFLTALGAHAAPLLFAAANKAAQELGPVLTLYEAGSLLAAAICPETKFGHLGAKTLVGCDLTHGGRTVFLPPDQCALHVGLSDWTRHTLAEAIMLPLEVAYSLAHATSTVPVFDVISIVVSEGLCSGQLTIRFPSGAHAVAYYGQVPQPGRFACAAHSISGDGLYAMGLALLDAEATDALPATGESLRPAAGALH